MSARINAEPVDSAYEDSARCLLLLVPGAGMHAGLVSILQRHAGRRKVFVPGRFIVISILAAAFGAFIGFKAS